MTHRLARRSAAVAGSSAHALVPPVLAMVLAVVVIRLSSVEVWGRFVSVWIVVQLAVHVIGWGNREYLLRAISRDPTSMAASWRNSLITRLALAAAVAVAALVLDPWDLPAPLVVGWCLLLVVHQSFEVLVLYRRAFAAAVAIEVAAYVVAIAAVLAVGRDLNVTSLVAIAAAAVVVRIAGLVVRFWRDVGVITGGRVDLDYFRRALPFLLLGLGGMLMSRSDLYCVTALLDPQRVGTYQVLTGLLLYVQSLAALVLLPFLKGLYRLPGSALRSLSPRMFLAGMVLIAPALVAIHWLLRLVYGLQVSHELLVMGGLATLPVFAISPLVFLAYRNHEESLVVVLTFAGAAVNVALSLVLIPAHGLLGALLATAVAHWLMLAALVIRERVRTVRQCS